MNTIWQHEDIDFAASISLFRSGALLGASAISRSSTASFVWIFQGFLFFQPRECSGACQHSLWQKCVLCVASLCVTLVMSVTIVMHRVCENARTYTHTHTQTTKACQNTISIRLTTVSVTRFINKAQRICRTMLVISL
jgi:hypothetical protein